MGKQAGVLRITGTIGNITFYKMNGVYYARKKSSLTAKRVKKDPAFRRTREDAGLLGQAATLVSPIYRELPAAKRGRPVYLQMISEAKAMLKAGLPVADIQAALVPAPTPVQVPSPVQPLRGLSAVDMLKRLRMVPPIAGKPRRALGTPMVMHIPSIQYSSPPFPAARSSCSSMACRGGASIAVGSSRT